jgi:hypothetical protein
MMPLRPLAAVLALLALVACGADGDPERPEPRPAQGVTLNGTVSFGIAGGS